MREAGYEGGWVSRRLGVREAGCEEGEKYRRQDVGKVQNHVEAVCEGAGRESEL